MSNTKISRKNLLERFMTMDDSEKVRLLWDTLLVQTDKLGVSRIDAIIQGMGYKTAGKDSEGEQLFTKRVDG